MPAATQLWMADPLRPLLREAGLDSVTPWLRDGRIRVWRDMRERQNGLLELDGHRFHVKRTRPPHGREVVAEVAGLRLLEEAGIATVPLVAWGQSPDGAGVLVTQDLTGFRPVDQRLAEGEPFSRFVAATAGVAAQLHGAGLHHRDLYLCHFLMDDPGHMRLIDAARVRRLPWLTRRRWIVKDLAQLRYSGLQAGAGEPELDAWLERWALLTRSQSAHWRSAVVRKSMRIARHNARLAQRQPERFVSLQ